MNDVSLIASALSTSPRWHERQLGVMIATGFLTILRYGELQTVRRDGVRVVFRSGREEVALSVLMKCPNANNIQGILIHVPWRKSNQDSDAWVPLSCSVTILRLLRHEWTLRGLGCESHRLFPSVSRKKGHPPHHNNYFGSQQFREGLRKALRDICGMTLAESKVYGGHSLRVGGSNYMRRMGVDPDVHRSLGGWAVLKSARDYMQLSPTEQFEVTRKLAVQRVRERGFEVRSQARTALHRLQQLALTG